MLKVRDLLVEAAMSGTQSFGYANPASVSWSEVLVTGIRIDLAVDRRRFEHRANPAAHAAPVDVPLVRRPVGHRLEPAPASGAAVGFARDLAAEPIAPT
jgi:hypothetical protein